MPCYEPLDAYMLKIPSVNKPKIIFDYMTYRNNPHYYEPVRLPCGRCVGCRLDYSRQWAVRCLHEASLYEKNMYLTLTYNDENLPWSDSMIPTLARRDFTLFMKRLRKAFPDDKIRYFFCGEYGEQTQRPHYHAIIFNFSFSDLSPDHQRPFNRFKQPLFESPTLDSIWGLGHCTIGAVTYESAGYVARYIMKKQLGKDTDKEDVTYRHRVKEFTGMSVRPGIGHDWFIKYAMTDVYPQGTVSVDRGTKKVHLKPPKYYDKLVEKYFGSGTLTKIKDTRRKKAKLDAILHPDKYERSALYRHKEYFEELSAQFERSILEKLERKTKK